MSIRKGFIVFSFLLMFASSVIVGNGQALTEQDSATLAIKAAEGAVISAFEAVLEAEHFGVSASGLILRLNEAVDLLAEAKLSLKNGDLTEAVELADHSVETAKDVKDEAVSLRITAFSHRESVFRASLIGSVVGIPAFLFLMYALWRWFKGFYTRKLLSLRPEVAQDVED